MKRTLPFLLISFLITCSIAAWNSVDSEIKKKAISDLLLVSQEQNNPVIEEKRIQRHTLTQLCLPGLVAYYPLDGDPDDYSGNDYHGSLTGSLPAINRFGEDDAALDFNGTSDYAEIPTPTLSGLTQGSFSAWTYFNGNSFGTIVDKTVTGSKNYFQLLVQNENAKLRLIMDRPSGSEATLFSNQEITANQWYHFVVAWDGDTVKMYINGVLDNQLASAADIDDNNVPILLGKVEDETRKLNGRLDDVMIYERALSAAEILQLYQADETVGPSAVTTLYEAVCTLETIGVDTLFLTNQAGCDSLVVIDRYFPQNINVEHPNLVAYYPFNGDAMDASGNNLNGVVSGPTLAQDRFRNTENAYYFDGINDRITVANSNLINLTSWTFSMWLKIDEVYSEAATIGFFGKEEKGLRYNYSIWYRPLVNHIAAQYEACNNDNDHNNYINGFNSYIGNWVHLASTRDNQTGLNKLYLNGALMGETTTPYLPCANTGNLIFGDLEGTADFKGFLDDIRIYSVSLTETEIQNIYLEETNNAVTFVSSLTCDTAQTGLDTTILTNQFGCDSTVVTLTSLAGPISNDGLLGFYPFDGDPDDQSGWGNDGQAIGPTLTENRFGEQDSSYAFGYGDMIELDNGIYIEGDFSVSLWYKITGSHNDDYSLIRTTLPPSFVLNARREGDGRFAFSLTGQNYLFSVDHFDGQWHHIVALRENQILKLYFDNNLHFEATTSSIEPIRIDRIGRGSLSEYFPGSIDALRVYERALTETEIEQLFDESYQSDETPLLASESMIDYGSLTIGDINVKTISLINTACDTLQLDSIFTSNSAFSVAAPQLILPPYASVPVEISFQPETSSFYLAYLEARSDQDTIQVELRGSGCISAPSLTYSGSTVLCNGDSLRLSGDGGETLNWITGEIADTITVFEPGDYFAIFSNQNGCLTYTDTVTITQIPDATIAINGATTLCEGDQTQLEAVNAAAYNWSTGENTQTISVQPLASAWYYVTATNSQACVYTDSVWIEVIPATPPGQPTNMTPADGALNLPTTITFSWLPPAFASTYDLYLWQSTESKPLTPTYANLNQILINHSNLIQGATYFWQLHAKNSCLETLGPVQSFTIASLPDLIVQNVQVPTNAFSGQSITISWEVHNQGAGDTGGRTWFDRVGLSEDNFDHTGGVDPAVAGKVNLTALNSGESYTNTATFDLPQGISGSYFIFIQTDSNRDLLESEEGNNNNSSGAYLSVTLTPPPDLQPTSLIAANNVFSEQYIPVNYTVENKGTGSTIASNWTDRVYLSAESEFNGNAVLRKEINHNGLLLEGENYTISDSIQALADVQGNFYVFVQTDAKEDVYEFIFEDNNLLASSPIEVLLTPPADLRIDAIGAVPTTIHNKESLDFTWTIQNAGFNKTNQNTWYDRLYWSGLDTFNVDSLHVLASIYHNGALEVGDTYQVNISQQMPAAIHGDYYLYLQTDARDELFEYEESNNRSDAIPVQILSPDLTPDSINHNRTAVSGQSMIVNYQVKNKGPGRLLDRNLTDRFWISSLAEFNPDSATLIANQSLTTSILSGDYLQMQAVIELPVGIAGQYYLYLKTDAAEIIFENGLESNNLLRSDSVIQISLQNFADLTPNDASLPDTAYAGQNLAYTYQVSNNGNADLEGESWIDKVYISEIDTLGADALIIGTFNLSEEMAAGESYSGVREYDLPPTLSSGYYYLYVLSDAGKAIFEHESEDNNLFRSEPFYITAHPPSDLEMVTASMTPTAPSSGQEVVFQWQVRNNGPATTIGTPWKDAVFLSEDSQLDDNDLEIAFYQKETALASDSSYTASVAYSLPPDSVGSYYFILLSDHLFRTNDSDTLNNYFVIGGDGMEGGEPIDIPLTPPPDLQVSAFTVPDEGRAGQPIEVIWTVNNNGAGTTIPSQWIDRIYLSTSPGPGGNVLESILRQEILAPGQSYTDTIELDLPLTVGGVYYLRMQTDASNQVYEHDQEGNNSANDLIIIEQSPPADLRADGIVSAQDSVTIGQNLSLDWQTKNIGANPAQGKMTDGLYLSSDTLWDVDDLLVETLTASVVLPPLGQLSRSLSAKISRAAYGWNYVLIRTDIKNNFAEEDENNNTAIGPRIFIDLKELPLNVLTSDTLRNEEELYYKVVVPDSLRGESLIVTLTGDTLQGFNETYVSYEQLPTRYEAQYQHQEALMGRQEVVVPDLLGGQYYNLSQGNVLGGNQQEVSLLAAIQPFEIKKVVSNRGGNTGNITVKITGARFEENMKARLSNSEKAIMLQAYEVFYANPTTVYASFNLNSGAYLGNQPIGIDTGYYDLRLIKSNGDIAALSDGFLVEEGGNLNIKVNVVYPRRTRTFRTAPITIEYENVGGVDIAVPKYLLVSLSNLPVGENEPDIIQAVRNNEWQGYREVQLELRDPERPDSNILKAGARGVLTVYTYITRAGSYNYKLIDLD